MLSEKEIILNIEKAKSGDEKAKELLFVSNTPLIKSVIRKFRNKGIEYDDLFEIGSLGFLKAIKNFDSSFNVKFSTYAVPMIVGEIKRYIRDNGAIKVSRRIKIMASKINRFIDEYTLSSGEVPKVEYIAENFGTTPEDVVLCLDSARMPVSIYDRVDGDDDGMELCEKIDGGENEEDKLLKIQLYDELEKLGEREKKIIYLRYFRAETQSEVAEGLGISQVQVSRIENKVLEKLKEKFDI